MIIIKSNKDFIEFLCKAKKNTYAGYGTEEENPSRPNSHDLIYEDGNKKYIDSYLGGERFVGEEAVWIDNVAVWAMNYSGRVLGENFSGSFLKEALYHVPKNNPYRGPLLYKKDNYTYYCEVIGTIEWFKGKEKIFFEDTVVYELEFHGGKII